MKRIMFWICRLLGFRYTQIFVGIVIMVAGASEIYEDFHEDGTIVNPAQGVTLLGLLTLVIALEHIIVGNEILVNVVASDKTPRSSAKALAVWLKRLFDSAYFQIAFGVLLILSGLGSAYEDIVNPSAIMSNEEGLWYLGIILIGVNVFCHGMSGLAFGVKRLYTIERQQNWRFRAVNLLNKIARNPNTEFILACSLITLGILEHFAFESQGENGLPIQAHHGMLIYGVSMLARLGTTVYFGLELAEDSYEQVQTHNDKKTDL